MQAYPAYKYQYSTLYAELERRPGNSGMSTLLQVLRIPYPVSPLSGAELPRHGPQCYMNPIAGIDPRAEEANAIPMPRHSISLHSILPAQLLLHCHVLADMVLLSNNGQTTNDSTSVGAQPQGTAGCAGCASGPGESNIFRRLVFPLLPVSSLKPPCSSWEIYERLSDTCTSRIQDDGAEYVRGSR